MINASQEFGKKGEILAASYLKKQGYKILEKNYKTKLGEIDIIAKDKATLVFVEVKTRQSNRFGNPKHSITYKKQKKISMVALYYLKNTRQMNMKARFDVVTLTFESTHPRIEIIKNAFELVYT